MTRLLPLWILLIGSIVLYMIAHAVQQDDFRHIRTLAELNAVTYGDNMIADLYAGISITDTLEQLLISTDGRIDKFDIIADRMMADYVRSIQVAPGGIVTDIYPAEGNEAGKIDLIHDKYRGETVNYSIANDVLIIFLPTFHRRLLLYRFLPVLHHLVNCHLLTYINVVRPFLIQHY